MATIKKPAKKMQNGGTAKGEGPDSYSKKLIPSTSKIRSEIMPKGKVKPPSKGIDIDSMLKKGSKKKDEPKVKLLKKGGKVNKAKSIKKK